MEGQSVKDFEEVVKNKLTKPDIDLKELKVFEDANAHYGLLANLKPVWKQKTEEIIDLRCVSMTQAKDQQHLKKIYELAEEDAKYAPN